MFCENPKKQTNSVIDPYEEKLYNLFKNFEVDGKLSQAGLSNLCHGLCIQERFQLLVKLLFNNGNKMGVTFEEFREGLLHVITSEDDGKCKLKKAQKHPAAFCSVLFTLYSLCIGHICGWWMYIYCLK
jgi:hypothetical protein